MYTACLKDATQHPDGTILDLGENKYYVFHVIDQQMPATSIHALWYTSSNNARYTILVSSAATTLWADNALFYSKFKEDGYICHF